MRTLNNGVELLVTEWRNVENTVAPFPGITTKEIHESPSLLPRDFFADEGKVDISVAVEKAVDHRRYDVHTLDMTEGPEKEEIGIP